MNNIESAVKASIENHPLRDSILRDFDFYKIEMIVSLIDKMNIPKLVKMKGDIKLSSEYTQVETGFLVGYIEGRLKKIREQ